MNIAKRDALIIRIADGEADLADAAGRAYMITGDPDMAAMVTINRLVRGGGQPFVGRYLRILTTQHPDHRLLSLLREVVERDMVAGWLEVMKHSKPLRDEVASRNAVAR